MLTVRGFLRGKCVFVTGGTGFVGKGVVAKILHRVPDVGRVYIPVRPRTLSNGHVLTVEERFEQEVFGSPVFDGLRRSWKDAFEARFRERVHAVAWKGLTYERFGIEKEIYEGLQAEIDVVINSAATVVFDEPIDTAMEQNALGAQRVLTFAKGCRNAVFVHVSTAYVSGQMMGRIREETIPVDSSVAGLMANGKAPEFVLDREVEEIRAYAREVGVRSESAELRTEFERAALKQNGRKRGAESGQTDPIDALKRKWIRRQMVEEGIRRGRRHGWHDSYTLSKAMGEQLIDRTRGDMPTGIVRPSIIESSLQDPEPGWLDGLKVADPLIAHFGKGRLSDFPANPDVVLDIIPVDLVANAILAVLPQLEAGKLKVYHVATGSSNPILLSRVFGYVYDYYKRNPVIDRDGRPVNVRRWRFPSPERFERSCWFRYKLPLILMRWFVDYVPFATARLAKRVSRSEATLERLMSLSETYSPYTTLDCRFETANIERVFEELDPEERRFFNLDVTRIDWREYIQDIHIPGLKRHVLKE